MTKEILSKILSSGLLDNLINFIIGGLVTFSVGLFFGKALPQYKKQREKLEKLYRDKTPDWLEPIFDKWIKKAQQQLIEELLKHSKGLDSETPTELQKTLKEIVDNATATRENNLKENLQGLVMEKVQEVLPVVSEKLLDKAQEKMINAVAFNATPDNPQYKFLQGVTENTQTLEIIKELKELPKDKNWIAQVYGEVTKEDGKDLEGKLGGSLTGRI